MTPLPELLSRLAAELRTLEALSDKVQSALSHALPLNGRSAIRVGDMQGLDALSQTLGGLAGFVSAMAAAAPQHLTLDIGGAVDELRLSALAQRLAATGAAAEAAQAEGELELF